MEIFGKLIPKFPIKFISTHVFKELNSSITFDKIKNMIVKEKLKLNAKSIGQCLTKALKSKKYSDKELKKVISSLKLLNIIEKSSRKIWHTYKCAIDNQMSSEALLDRFQNIYGQVII